ncbi:MAG: sugar-phosphatase [Streptococcaceae bacterium]|jgi:Cof subfamily protein (haloacid dehalogenase superfamily)|nr:sugar-phosphatase [Streptococcaceae bacterium]
MSIKLVAVDIDGTLITSDRILTEKTKEAVFEARRQGVKIVLTTGRPLPGVHDLLAQLNLTQVGDYVITYNGALVQNSATGEILVKNGVTHDEYLEIDLMARKLNVHMHAITATHIYTANRDISPYTVHESTLVGMPIRYRTQEEMTPDMEIIKTMYIDEPEFLTQVIEQLPKTFRDKFTTVKSSPFYFEVLNKQASKGAALTHLAEQLGIGISETMAVGDEENDLSMLEAAGFSVAMGNTTNQRVLEVTDAITSSNDEDGFAEALYKYVLK